MILNIEEVNEVGEKMLPAMQLSLEQSVVAIYTDVTKMNLIKAQLEKHKNIFVHTNQMGHYERLTVLETLRFYIDLYNAKQNEQQLLKEFNFEDRQKVRVNELSAGEREILSFIRPYLDFRETFVFVEPFQNLQSHEIKVIFYLIKKMQQYNKKIMVISGNLQNLMLLESEVFRLDLEGIHSLDVKEEEQETEKVEVNQLKIEKIPTKKNDKIILFNPPEIDYIESVEGEVLVYVAGEGYPCTWTLNDLEKRLMNFGFFRCHRSYIVNLQKVREIISWTRNSYSLSLIGTSKSEVPLSRSKLAELKSIVGI